MPFPSKILEKFVLTQLQSHLMSNNILEKFQSGFKSQHSMETALLKVVNYIWLETDKGSAVALVLLDLSSAFDMVDHNILISRLESCVGLQGKVLKWFQYFLTNRSLSVSIGQHSSSSHQLACGVPQGSILAPVLFLYSCCQWVLSLRNMECPFTFKRMILRCIFPSSIKVKNS